MSLQVCHCCGWSKKTTYQGLRTHQGKMGCTPKGMRIPETQYFECVPQRVLLPAAVEYPVILKTPASSDPSEVNTLQTCHCGWSGMTTYHGLRTHQGMMGCTPKGVRIPKNQQLLYFPQVSAQNTPDKLADVELFKTPAKSENLLLSAVVKSEPFEGKLHPILDKNFNPFVSLDEQLGLSGLTQVFTAEQTHLLQTPVNDSTKSFFETPPHSQSVVKTRRALDFSAVPENNPQTAAQDAAINLKVEEAKAEKMQQAKQGKVKAELQQKILIREKKMQEVLSAQKSCAGSLDAEWLEINRVFSEVIQAVEDARREALEPLENRRKNVKKQSQNILKKLQKEVDELKQSMEELENGVQVPPTTASGQMSDLEDVNFDTSVSFGSLRATTSAMKKDIEEKLEQLSCLELRRIRSFAVEVKLDLDTAHHCLEVSEDGKRVCDGGMKPKDADTPERFDMFGSVLGKPSFKCGRSYWEVEVRNKTGWDLGVARRNAKRKGVVGINTDCGYWVTVHYQDHLYAAMTVPPVSLALPKKPLKVGVFVDYEEGLVSFYDVSNQSHIYSFTECSFRDEIIPYFSPHLKTNGQNGDPLIICPVKAKVSM